MGMRKGTRRSPIQPKSKEQLLDEIKKNTEFIKRMKFVKEEFWPALLKASQNIEDASILLSGFNNVIMESFLSKMKEIKMSDLDLTSKLDKESPKYTENQALLALFQDMDIFHAKELIEGMKNEIQQFISDELKERPLASLKTKWIDEL